jgi:hypothetical protein
MNQEFCEKKSQSAVKGKKSSAKKLMPSKIKKIETDEKKYYCFTCEFGTNDKKDYKRYEESKKHIKNEEMEKREIEEEMEKRRLREQEEIKQVFWKKHSPAICRKGCEYVRGEKYWDIDGIRNTNWLCQKCDEEECERLFRFSKKPQIENVIISVF